MYGRGSCDTKCRTGRHDAEYAVASLHEEGIQPACDVWLAAVVDEEFSFRGVVKLCEGLTGNAALIAEPTELRAVIASKGVLRWRMISRGKAAHSGKPHLGVNAINHMARVVLALEEDHRRMASQVHPLLGAGHLQRRRHPRRSAGQLRARRLRDRNRPPPATRRASGRRARALSGAPRRIEGAASDHGRHHGAAHAPR